MTAVIHTGLPIPTRLCTEHDLDRRIGERDRMFSVAVKVGHRRVEFFVRAPSSCDAANVVVDTLELPAGSVRSVQ